MLRFGQTLMSELSARFVSHFNGMKKRIRDEKRYDTWRSPRQSIPPPQQSLHFEYSLNKIACTEAECRKVSRKTHCQHEYPLFDELLNLDVNESGLEFGHKPNSWIWSFREIEQLTYDIKQVSDGETFLWCLFSVWIWENVGNCNLSDGLLMSSAMHWCTFLSWWSPLQQSNVVLLSILHKACSMISRW